MTVIGLVLVTGLALLLVYETRQVLTWMVIAAFFATALYPAVNWVEHRAAWCRRWLATLLVFLAFLAVLAGVITLFVVPLAHEAVRLADQLPGVANDVQRGRGPIGSLVEQYHIRQYIADHREQLQGYARGLGAPTLAFLRGAATTVAGVVTIFVLAYLMVLEAPKLVDGFLALFPERRAERIRRVGADCARSVTGYITGNLLISVICGLATYAVLFFTGVPYAGLIAAFVAIADLIPLVGATLGAVVAVGAAFLHSTTAGIVVLVFFVVYQQVENHLLQPIILARTVALNPLAVLVAILVAVELAGILGALLAIPVAGMIQTIARDVWNERQGRLKSHPTVGPQETPADVAEPPEARPGGNQPPVRA
ncbi:AI-2E family transporter [Dactylosporangium matsuzakiense]|uniref:AI-2E family transporter n=1 Tax=Dactylosporangium matsuzakiense TaxID=53360 RepID=A0A9W6NTD6_9ACTN|nr:AI-2E family transporter [Dactylosporangium matsuzakiense]GLL08291.1 AI-2E family transporter [Dactylosporangium matsuzakiense]